MAAVRFYLNVTLDGCYDHRAAPADEDSHRRAMESIERSDTLLLGRVTYQMMEEAWRLPTSGDMPAWTEPFARTIDAARKHVVSSTLTNVDWNAELVTGDLGDAVRRLKQESERGVSVGGVQLAMALAERGLIDEYELLVHPRIVGHGPSLFAGLSRPVDLDLVDRHELPSGAVALRYETRR